MKAEVIGCRPHTSLTLDISSSFAPLQCRHPIACSHSLSDAHSGGIVTHRYDIVLLSLNCGISSVFFGLRSFFPATAPAVYVAVKGDLCGGPPFPSVFLSCSLHLSPGLLQQNVHQSISIPAMDEDMTKVAMQDDEKQEVLKPRHVDEDGRAVLSVEETGANKRALNLRSTYALVVFGCSAFMVRYKTAQRVHTGSQIAAVWGRYCPHQAVELILDILIMCSVRQWYQ